jgi:CRISPR-associated protein Cas5d
VFGEGEGFYDDLKDPVDFGMMFHGFDYPDDTGKNELGVRLWLQKMSQRGKIEFAMPEDVEQHRVVREYGAQYTFKRFEEGVNLNIELVP